MNKKIIIFMLVVSINVFSITAFDRAITNTRIGGYMDTEFVSQDKTNTFKAHRYILQVGSRINDKILFNSEVEYEYGAKISDGGDGSNAGELKIEQAWVDFKMNSLFTLRSGIVLIPVGQLNIFHDSDIRDFTARPLVNRYIIPTTWMDTGVGGYGSMEVVDAELTYEGYLTNGLTDEDIYHDKNGTRSMRPNFKKDSNKGKSISGRVGYIPNVSTSLGLSAYRGNAKQQIFALDGNYKQGLWH